MPNVDLSESRAVTLRAKGDALRALSLVHATAERVSEIGRKSWNRALSADQ